MTRYDTVHRRSNAANYLGATVGFVVVVLAAIGYEHIIDTFGLYEWQRLDDPSPRTVPFLVGLVAVTAVASASEFWVARFLSRRMNR